jgi:hypothetical protein
LSAAPNALEATYAQAWADAIWTDMLG